MEYFLIILNSEPLKWLAAGKCSLDTSESGEIQWNLSLRPFLKNKDHLGIKTSIRAIIFQN